MSQLGRCTKCNTHLMKVHGKDKDGLEVEIEVCPNCILKPNSSRGNLGKALDKYGMEVLEK